MKAPYLKLFYFVCCLFFSVFCFPSFSSAQVKHEFVGVKKCSLCHKGESKGDQYKIWLASPHAKAYETLGTAEAKKVAKKFGIDDPQKSGKCLKCHSTAYYFTESIVTDGIPVEEGVSCESCHGPGKDYMKKSIMENKHDAIANGLLIADEKVCVKCHNQESPAYRDFKYAESFEKIKHPQLKK